MGDRREGKEMEANVFACALLMPPEWIARDLVDLERAGGIDLEDDKVWKELATKYQVSATALVWWIGILHEKKIVQPLMRSIEQASAWNNIDGNAVKAAEIRRYRWKGE